MKKKKKNFDDEATMIFSETLTENPKKKKKKGKIVLLIFIILAILASGAYLALFLLNNNKKDTANKEEKVTDTSGWTTYTKPKKVAKILYIYNETDVDDNIYVYVSNDANDVNFTKVGEYSCISSDCEAPTDSSYTGKDNFAVIYDNNCYYIYDYENNKIFKTSLNEKYASTSFEYRDKVIYGLTITKDRETYKQGFYSYNQNKITVDFIYDELSISSYKDQLFGTIGKSESFTIDIISITTGEIIHRLKNVDHFITIEYITDNNTCYIILGDEDTGPVDIYNDNFTLLFHNIEYNHFEIKENGNIVVVEGNQYREYDQNKNLVKTSKEYQKVIGIMKGYAAVVDDNYIVLLDKDENVIAKFMEYRDSLFLISFYYSNAPIEGEGTILRVIMDYEDTLLSEGTMGVTKECYYNVENGKSGIKEYNVAPGYGKPVLYLYPEKETKVTVTFEKPELLTTTYPKFINQWQVTASPNGDLYDAKGQYYYGLYWEESGSTKVDFSTGFYVTKDNAIKFLEEKLTIIGLNARERNEFIMYWLPILEKNGQNLVYFELTEERNAYNKININPVPDSLLRLAIHVKKVDKKVNIKEEKLTTFTRQGFTAVEWGGVNH